MIDCNGAPDRIRTHDPQIRSLVLYPAELRALTGGVSSPLAGEKQVVFAAPCHVFQVLAAKAKPRDFSRGSV